jgi:hypothetical protein
VGWTASSEPDVTGYYVYWAQGDNPDDWVWTKRAVVATNSDTIDALTDATPYWVYVTAKNVAGLESQPSAIVRCLAGAGNSGDEADSWGIADLAAAITDNDPSVALDLTWTPALYLDPDHLIICLYGPDDDSTPANAAQASSVEVADGVESHYFGNYSKSMFEAATTVYWRVGIVAVVINDRTYRFGSVQYSNADSVTWPS